jgi:putative SOS response-associated peptidase YedK
MAGLWERWMADDNVALESCTIIVTDANDLVRNIHDRMPVILAREEYEEWLGPDNTDLERLSAILKPTDPDPWTMHPVSRQVNSPRNDGPQLLEIAETAVV